MASILLDTGIPHLVGEALESDDVLNFGGLLPEVDLRSCMLVTNTGLLAEGNVKE